MAIHYENYARFSRGQGFVGSACRPLGALVTSARFFAVDCGDCKRTLVGRRVISRTGSTGIVESAEGRYVDIVSSGTGEILRITFDDLDRNWAPLDLEEIFGEKGSAK